MWPSYENMGAGAPAVYVIGTGQGRGRRRKEKGKEEEKGEEGKEREGRVMSSFHLHNRLPGNCHLSLIRIRSVN